MSINLEMTIDQIFAHLRELGRPTTQMRRPGLGPTIVTGKLGSLGLRCPDDLILLYGLCDGTETAEGDPLDEIHLFPGYYWMKLDEAIETYSSLVEEERWNAAWLPILANGGGDFYAVIGDEKSSDFGGLVGFILGESDHLVEFKNVTALFQTIEQAFTQKAFFLANGYLEADYPKLRAIARNVQPDFEEHDA